MMGPMMGWGYGMMGGWFGMLIPLILIGVIVYAVIRLSGNSNVRNEREYDNSLAILNERFARGEINEEEYKQKKAILLRR
ncbi:SHOCT domain-containing protein [Petroclostridium sp. X23]|jgi:putative membrane protein|uniref:SHOCT domain-containing protein n=1 Tax=Petroclostridium sp. X23 TaxID=3045146 RepID=UPI0024AE088C|nr:SHOCT domain-containing protein [Petroclostridium sp. X23]WHH59959.1 SHOCT domain-containing protein [Petroclostridium sp. X23]